MALRYSFGLFALAVVVACSGTSTSHGPGGGSGAAAGAGGSDATGGATGGRGGSTTGSGGRGGVGGTGAVAAFGGAGGGSFCGGLPCDAPLSCCTATGECFDPAEDPEACEEPPPDDADPRGRKPCSSNAHCGPREFCKMDEATCIGSGHCELRSNCGSCLGDDCVVCGCDGNTYPSFQTACLAGVDFANWGACGEPKETGGGGSGGSGPDGGAPVRVKIPCAHDGQCPEGQVCCPRFAECVLADDPYLCEEPPPGTRKPCFTDEQCEGNEYCLGEGCDGPGGCVHNGPEDECGVRLEPVCGCNGVSYTSAACASTEGVRVAFAGQCPAK